MAIDGSERSETDATVATVDSLHIDDVRFARLQAEFGEHRSRQRVEAHLACELRLADRLRMSTSAERRGGLYTAVYGELFATLPDHPQHHKAAGAVRADVSRQVALLRQLAEPGATVLEIGAGDGAVSRALADAGYRPVAVDVSDGVADTTALAASGVDFLITDGVRMPLETGSVDVAYSNQLIEHLHPDDAFEQLQEVRRVLRPGGIYYLVTPHRLTGPHDVSIYLGDVPLGLHLQEFDSRTLAALARRAGFRRVAVSICRGDRVLMRLPYELMAPIERLLGVLARLRLLAPRRSRVARLLLGMHALLVA